MGKFRAVIAGAGTIMICALGVLAGFYWSGWAHDHPTAVFRAMLALFIGAVLCAAFWLVTNDRTPAENKAEQNTIGDRSPLGVSGITTGGDVKAGGDVKNIVAEHYYESSKETPIGFVPDAGTKIPKLLMRPHPTVCLSHDSQMITRSETGKPGMIVRIENPEAGVGQKGIKAHGVVAIIRFCRPSGEIAGTSEYAFWLDTYENAVTIEPGTSKEMVIGIYSNPKVWQYFTNKLDSPPPRPVTGGQFRNYMERMSRPLAPDLIFMNPTIDAHITLISKRDHYTLAKKSFKLYPVQNSLGQTIDFMFEELP
jgi:hypothetical protein